MKKTRTLTWVAGASLMVIASAAQAQQAQDQAKPSSPQAQASDGLVIEEVVVTARRRSESLQDVPQTVNAVTGADLEKLNIQKFEDVASVVPGLTLSTANTGYTTVAAIRGAPFQAETGANPTVEFYLNDTLASSLFLFQSTYDIGQIEVLRGPQGTLRGRASPSGSITVTTRKPDMESFGGYVSASDSDQRSRNINGAVNIPIVRDQLSLRIAGLYDDNDYDQVHSINSSLNPYSRTKSGRASLRFEPSDTFNASIVYQRIDRKLQSFDQVQSYSLINPAAAASPRLIRASDRLGITDGARRSRVKQDMVIGQASLKFGGQVLNYVGSYNETKIDTQTPSDQANFFANLEYYQTLDAPASAEVHELRLSNQDKLWGMIDYTVGVFHTDNDGRSALVARTPVTLFGSLVTVAETPIVSLGAAKETSVFGNITAHLGDKTELAGGLRRIDYESSSDLQINGLSSLKTNRSYSPTVYNLSISHRLTDDITVYANTGSSWRAGPFLVGIFQPLSPRLQKYMDLKPEKSQSYEGGVKTELFDRRLRLNVAAFHQKFDGFIYRGSLTPYVQQTNAGQNVGLFNFASNVDAEINGVDIDYAIQASHRLSISGGFSYAKGKIKNSTVACQDLDHNGQVDAVSTTPTLAELQASTGGEAVAECKLSGRLSTSPNWSFTVVPEYSLPVRDGMNAFVRGLLTYYPKNQQDVFNLNDAVDAYGMVNLYAGLRDDRGAWELSFFAKNVTNTGQALNNGPSVLATTYQALRPPTFRTTAAAQFNSTYVSTRYTAPREVGISLRYAFGSR